MLYDGATNLESREHPMTEQPEVVEYPDGPDEVENDDTAREPDLDEGDVTTDDVPDDDIVDDDESDEDVPTEGEGD